MKSLPCKTCPVFPICNQRAISRLNRLNHLDEYQTFDIVYLTVLHLAEECDCLISLRKRKDSLQNHPYYEEVITLFNLKTYREKIRTDFNETKRYNNSNGRNWY